MEAIASPAQKERWLKPQVAGHTRSCFAMTEPDGAGSDPGMLATTAVRDGDHYVINGTKWLITGAEGAHYAIIMARMEDGSATMFLSDMDRPGIRYLRTMEAMDRCFTGGHGVLAFEDLRIPATDVLGEIGQGFRYAQVRLAPARLHIWHTAWVLDRSVQILGGRGVTGESIVMRIFTDMRAFRVYDGPSEVHRWSLGRKIVYRAGQASGR